jgi:hypothetical protein
MSAPAVPGSSSKREKRAFSWRKIARNGGHLSSQSAVIWGSAITR